ncbi:MAG: type II secretion system F family protein, partial [Planctomycetota bacterium]
SLPQAFDMVVREQPAPIKQEFHILSQEMRLGVPMEDGLKNLWRRMPSEDMQLFMIAVNISKEVGGDLMSVFSNIAVTIRERFRIEGKIQAMTGQGRMQGMVVSMMPPAMGVILNIIDPVMTSLLWTTMAGWILIITVTIMEVVGYLWIQSIVNIDI